MRQVHVYVPATYIERIDALIEKGCYPHRSEVVRLAIRDLLIAEGKWYTGEG